MASGNNSWISIQITELKSFLSHSWIYKSSYVLWSVKGKKISQNRNSQWLAQYISSLEVYYMSVLVKRSPNIPLDMTGSPFLLSKMDKIKTQFCNTAGPLARTWHLWELPQSKALVPLGWQGAWLQKQVLPLQHSEVIPTSFVWLGDIFQQQRGIHSQAPNLNNLKRKMDGACPSHKQNWNLSF